MINLMTERLKYKHVALWVLLLCLMPWARAQSVSLTQCVDWAKEHYPTAKNRDLIRQTANLQSSQAAKGYWPQLSLQGQWIYQSDVTSLPFEIPGFQVPAISQEQYKVWAEVFVPLTNRPAIARTQEGIRVGGAVEEQQLEVELYPLHDRVSQAYFGLLLLQEQGRLLELYETDLQNTLSKTRAAVDNGIAIENNALLLEAELLTLAQQREEQNIQKQALLDILSLLTGQPMGADTELQWPAVVNVSTAVVRPELRLFELQGLQLDTRLRQLNTRYIPTLGLFAQGGYGQPALNFLSNEADAYYIAGVRFSWNLAGLYSLGKEKQMLEVTQQRIANQRENFLLNTQLSLVKAQAEVDKYRVLLQTDTALIAKRMVMQEAAAVQLENGLISALDFINYLTATDKARQNQALHEVQLLMAQDNARTIVGY